MVEKITLLPVSARPLNRRPGSRVNLETDIIAKHVAKLLGRTATSGLTIKKLEEMGY